MNQMSKELILASTSPRRRDLITHFDLPFRCVSVDVDETPHAEESAKAMVQRLAGSKARSAVAEFPDAIIVAADTTVDLDGQIIGKPSDAADAVRMLKRLRGRAHRVYSGVVVGTTHRHIALLAETVVWMRDYSDHEIEAYVATGDPLDKAAAYAIQHPTFRPVARIEGCYSNVMGLPLCRVYLGLREVGIEIPNYEAVLSSQYELDCPVAREVLKS